MFSGTMIKTTGILANPHRRSNTNHQLKTIQKIEHNLAYMDYAMIFLSIVLLVISIKVQAALWIFDLSAIALIILAARKRISQENVVYHCGKDDRMALPSVDFLNPLPCFHLC